MHFVSADYLDIAVFILQCILQSKNKLMSRKNKKVKDHGNITLGMCQYQSKDNLLRKMY